MDFKENPTQDLGKFGVKKTNAKLMKKTEQEAKTRQLKSAAQKYIDTIAESNMSEMQLEAKHFNEQLQQLEKYLQKKAITKSQYDAAVLDANSAFNNKIFEQLAEQQSKRGRVSTKNKSVKTKTAQDAWSRYRLLLTKLILQA